MYLHDVFKAYQVDNYDEPPHISLVSALVSTLIIHWFPWLIKIFISSEAAFVAGMDGAHLVESDVVISWSSKPGLMERHFSVGTSAFHLRSRDLGSSVRFLLY